MSDTISQRNSGGVNVAVTGVVAGNVVVHAGEPTSPRRTPLWTIPPQLATVVERPILLEQAVATLINEGTGPVALTAALHGTGGFGKTTLAEMICHEPRIRSAFPGGIAWLTLGEHAVGVRLAEKINNLTEMVCGIRPTLTDPEQAGFHLGTVLDRHADAGPRLLVLDDVWHADQLRPLLSGGADCRRLITTRVTSILPSDVKAVTVDAMEVQEARQLLSLGLDLLSDSDRHRLLAVTGRWPVLLSLVNAAIRRRVREGLSTTAAAAAVLARIEGFGPTALDIRSSTQRAQAVARTMDASLDLLDREVLQRYLELAVFPDDVLIEEATLAQLWSSTAGLDTAEVEPLCEEFADLGLVQRLSRDPAGIQLHDIVLAYLKSRIRRDLPELHRTFLAGLSDTLPGRSDAPSESSRPLTPWWLLKPEETYLWRYLGYHMRAAGLGDEFAEVAVDLRFISMKLSVLGPLGVQSDLMTVDDPVAAELSNRLRRRTHLMRPLAPTHGLGATLVYDVPRENVLAGAVRRWYQQSSVDHLTAEHPALGGDTASLCQALPGHDDYIRALNFSSDGRYLISGADDGTVCIRDSFSGTLRQTWQSGHGWVWVCEMDPTSTWVVTAGGDGEVRMWDAESGRLRRSWSAHIGAILTGAIIPMTEAEDSSTGPRLVTAGEDGRLRVWSVTDGTDYGTWSAGVGTVLALACDPSGSWVVAVGEDGHAAQWWLDGTLHRRWIIHDGWGTACAISEDGQRIATAGEDRLIRIWDSSTGDLQHELVGHGDRIWALTFGPTPMELASASEDQLAIIWRLTPSGSATALAFNSGTWALALATDPAKSGAASDWLLTAGADGLIRRWDSQSVPEHEARSTTTSARGGSGKSAPSDLVIATPTQTVRCCAFSPSGTWAVTGGDSDEAVVWSLLDGRVLRTFPTQGAVYSCAIDPSGKRVALGLDTGEALVWELGRSQPLAILLAATARVRTVAFGIQPNHLITAGDDTCVRVWDLTTGFTYQTLDPATKWSAVCALSTDGRWIAVVDHHGGVRLWRPGADTVRNLVPQTGTYGRTCTFTADSDALIYACDDGRICRYELLPDTPGVESDPYTAAFQERSPVTMTNTDPQHRLLGRHDGPVLQCSVSLRRGLLVTVGKDDRTVRVWEPRTGECRAALRLDSELHGCQWSPVDDQLLVVGTGGVARLRYTSGRTIEVND